MAGLWLPIRDRPLGLLDGSRAPARSCPASRSSSPRQAIDQGGFVPLALGLAAGALAFYTGDRLLDRGADRSRQSRPRGADAEGSGGTLALGALLDGVPEAGSDRHRPALPAARWASR